MMWTKEPPESFLDIHELYRAVHRGLWQHWSSINRIDPVFFHFKPNEKGLSFDWSKYATPTDTLNRRKNSTLKDYGIIQLNIGEFNDCVNQFDLPLEIDHDPVPNNQSHTILRGISKANKAKIRRKLSKITNWVEGMKPIQ